MLELRETVATDRVTQVFYLEGVPVGFITLSRHTETRWLLSRIYVAPEYRDRGLSSEMVALAFQSRPGVSGTNLLPAWVAVWYMTHGYPILPGPYLPDDPEAYAERDAEAATEFATLIGAP